MKRLLLGWLVILIAAAVPACALAQADTPHIHLRILAASADPAPRSAIDLGIEIDPGSGWHVYWQNPGETGYPPRFSWILPTGFAIGPVTHPAPQRIMAAGTVANVHVGPVVLLTRLTVPPRAAVGSKVLLTGSADLLVCSDSMCVPQTVAFDRALTIGSGAPDMADAAALQRAWRRLPEELPGIVGLTRDTGRIRMSANLPAPASNEKVTVFPVNAGTGGLGDARYVAGDPATLEMPQGTFNQAGRIDLVVTYAKKDTAPSRAFLLHAQAFTAPASVRKGSAWLALVAVGGALLGGLLLNLMPCVFPILSLKAITLIRAGADRREARSEAVGYLVGAVGVMVLLGGAVLLLRAGGTAAGWAFQLQDARVVSVLLVLVMAIATNLAGLFELPSLPVAFTGRSGLVGGIGTGALAAFIATPCTGPFMAGALGAALVLPPAVGLLVFAALGTGLAVPFLLIGFYEPARRLLPRPGMWMVTLRHLLSLPMFATALGLAWLLGQQTGVSGMTAGLGIALLAGVTLWWAGLRQRVGKAALPAVALVAAILCLCLWVPVGAGTAKNAGLHSAAASANGVIPYSAKALADLRARHRPVLLYATADWCLTCKVNEASSLSSAAVQANLARVGALLMEADWTKSDPAVSRLLAQNGRAGVPLYIWYPPQGSPQILPQILTPALIGEYVSG